MSQTDSQQDKPPDTLTAYIIHSASIYSTGAWDGRSVAQDMLLSASITPKEVAAVLQGRPQDITRVLELLPSRPAA